MGAELFHADRQTDMTQLTVYYLNFANAPITHDQHIIRYLGNPKLHYRVQNSPPPVPILSQMNPIKTLPFQLFKTHFNITLKSTTK